ncbi:Uncharacterised protein [Bordetella ansorpii]|uniref:Uncharacterized protein n=1 Tax=Bordetella ansorpii TaxID=288768 RepID=A0A157PJD5_9BORD|nr:Uncharacterised protein [Bordetella ansorpii]
MDFLTLAVFGAMAGLTWALVAFCARLSEGEHS